MHLTQRGNFGPGSGARCTGEIPLRPRTPMPPSNCRAPRRPQAQQEVSGACGERVLNGPSPVDQGPLNPRVGSPLAREQHGAGGGPTAHM